MDDIIAGLYGKDAVAYALCKQICLESEQSDKYRTYFDAFVAMLDDKSSYVRTRGFLLACAMARWDTNGRLEAALPTLLARLNDDKPTAVRGYLAALHTVVQYRPELKPRIADAVNRIDYTRYKDSMAPLIKKDAEGLLEYILTGEGN